MATYEEVHAGATVLGHDHDTWGVESIVKDAGHIVVTLVKDEGRTRVTGYPPPGTPVTILSSPDLPDESAAWQVLADAGLDPEIVYEQV